MKIDDHWFQFTNARLWRTKSRENTTENTNINDNKNKKI